MQLDSAILVGLLVGCSVYLILQTSFVKIAFGLVLFANAVNLFILSMSGSPQGKDAPIAKDLSVPMADPLPQALILTAIVIGFAVLAYIVILLYRLFLDYGTTNARELFEEKKKEEPHP